MRLEGVERAGHGISGTANDSVCVVHAGRSGEGRRTGKARDEGPVRILTGAGMRDVPLATP